MHGKNNSLVAFEDFPINVKLKLSALWVSVMLCYLYGDYFGLYKPDSLNSMMAGQMGPLGPVTQGVLLATSVLMAIPAVMVFLSLVLKPAANRWVNITMGVFYTFIMLVSLPGSWYFYIFFGILEMGLTLLIVWQAWKWPKQPSK